MALARALSAEPALDAPVPRAPKTLDARPRVAGKFLYAGDEKLWLKGVTYGTFRPGPGGDYPQPEQLDADFSAMAAAGINAVRVYTVPPRAL
ncbi:MAG TPA: hypothetical protein VI319_03995, partial [Burkholderiales bacterium]